MGLAEILNQVVALVGTAVPTGKVHLGLRQFRTREHFHSAAMDTASQIPAINVWFVTRGKTTEQPHSTGSHLRKHPVTIAGFLQVNDPTYDPNAVAVGNTMTSEMVMSGYTEAICDKLRNDASLHGIVATNSKEPQVTVWEIKALDEQSCHAVEIEVEVEEEVLVAFV